MKKVLIVRFSSIGDIVLTTPVIRCIKKYLPDTELHFLTKSKFELLVKNNPNIDKVHTIVNDINEVKTSLKAEDFDFIVDLHKNLRSLRLRLALKKKSYQFPKLNFKKWLLTTFKINKMPDIHIVDRYFSTVSDLGVKNDFEGLDYFIPKKDEINLKEYHIHEDFVAYALGAQFHTKRLPASKIIELLHKTNKAVVLLGSVADLPVAREITQACNNAINLCGDLNLNQSASVIKQSQKVIAHDTGLMHIAAAFKKPIISIWGNTVPELGMYPYMPSNPLDYSIHEVKGLSCRPCSKIGSQSCPKKHFDCMNKQDLDKIAVERPDVEVSDKDLDEMFETLQKQHQTWKENKRKTKKGDKLTLDFTGRVDGKEFEGGKAEGFELELGAGRMIPGFEKEITGMKVGEEKTIQVTFPDDYHAENLKGKDAEFDVVVHKTEGPVLPKVDEEFAKLFGVEEGGVEALREEVSKNMSRELSQAVKAKVKEQVIDGLLEGHEVGLPSALVEQEVDVLRKQAMQRFQGQMDPKNLPELPSDMFKEQAERRVKIGLLLGEVIKVNELKVDNAKVDELIATAASAYEDPQEVVDYYASNKELMQQMQNVALEEQAIDFLVAQAKVKNKKASFKDIMNPEGK